MAQSKHDRLVQDLLALKLNHIAENYKEVLDEAARLPVMKTLTDYDFTFPKKAPKQKILRLFDCQFIETFSCAVLIGATGVGKPQPPQYTSSYRGVRG